MKPHLLALTALLVMNVLLSPARAQSDLPPGGTPALATDALLTTTVGGLERTQSTATIVPVTGQSFDRALHVTIGAPSAETNATQLTMPIATPVAKGDVLLASFWSRGTAVAAKTPARLELLFEKTIDPWTKSVTQDIAPSANGNTWKRVLVPFAAADSYAPGEAMVSLRFAFGPQTVEVGGLSVVDYAKTKTVEELVALAATLTPLGNVTAAVRWNILKQTMLGFGGDFCQPRYGSSELMDAVGQYNLKNLRVAHARIGIPLNVWAPEKGVYKDEGPAHAALLQMQMMAKAKIPITGSIWEGPQWLLPGTAEQGRVLPRENYDDCIEAIAQFLVTARDKYGANVDTFSFNEADYGVNFKFTSATIADFIRLAGPRWAALGLKTKFIAGDTGNGSNCAEYARPLLEDKTIAPYVGPLAFHCWDALGAQEASYVAIAELGRQYHKPIWCLEAGHDAGLWQKPNPWAGWENALRTALAYERTLRLTGASLMDYWTYEDNYPLVTKDGTTPYPVWHVVRQMEDAFTPGWRIATASSSSDDLKVLPAMGPQPGQFSILLVNPIGAGQVTLAGLPPGATISVVQSTEAAQRHQVAIVRADGAGHVTLALPARSIVTLVSRVKLMA